MIRQRQFWAGYPVRSQVSIVKEFSSNSRQKPVSHIRHGYCSGARPRRRHLCTTKKTYQDRVCQAKIFKPTSTLRSVSCSGIGHQPCTVRSANQILQGCDRGPQSTFVNVSRKVLGYVGRRKNDSTVCRSVIVLNTSSCIYSDLMYPTTLQVLMRMTLSPRWLWRERQCGLQQARTWSST